VIPLAIRERSRGLGEFLDARLCKSQLFDGREWSKNALKDEYVFSLNKNEENDCLVAPISCWPDRQVLEDKYFEKDRIIFLDQSTRFFDIPDIINSD